MNISIVCLQAACRIRCRLNSVTLFSVAGYLEVLIKNEKVTTLIPLSTDDREQFLLDNQWAFKYGAMMEFVARGGHIDGEIISRATLDRFIDEPCNDTYRIMLDGKRDGIILKIDKATHHNCLEILFVLSETHSRGIGYDAWQAVEALHPKNVVWQTCTPYCRSGPVSGQFRWGWR